MAAPQPTTITLRCKVPAGHIAGAEQEFTLGQFASTAKVSEVRQRIQEQIPGNPAPAQQRILYAGRAFGDDEQSLADAFNIKRDPTQDTYVIHLLIRGEGSSWVPPSSRRATPTATTPNPHEANNQQSIQPPLRPQQAASPQSHLTLQQQEEQAHILAQHQQAHAAAHHQHMVSHMLQRQQQMFPGLPLPAQFAAHLTPGMAPQFVGQQQHGVLRHPAGAAQEHGPEQQQPPVQVNGIAGQPPTPAAHISHQHAVTPGVAPSTPHNQGQVPQTPQGHQQPNPQLPGLAGAPGVHVQGMSGVNQAGQRITVQGFSMPFPGPPFGLPRAFPGPQAPGPMQHPVDSLAASLLANRSRETLADIQRRLEQLRTLNGTQEEQRVQIEEIQERARLLSEYVNQPRSLPVRPNAPHPSFNVPQNLNPIQLAGPFGLPIQTSAFPQPPAVPNSTNVTAYLLSSPAGPYAILTSPQHGTFTSQLFQAQQPIISPFIPTPTLPIPQQGVEVQQGQIVLNQGNPMNQGNLPAELQRIAVPANANVAQDNRMIVFNFILGQLWLLFRIMIFAYFLLGSQTGWRRPLILIGIGVAFWIIRAGLLAPGGPLRAWWDDIMRVPQRGAAAPNANAQPPRDGPPAPDNRPEAERVAAARRMPTPEEFAQRLLNQEARANAAVNPQIQWIRDRVRPVERATALFVGSLWPGVGEAAVQVQEQEARRRAEEEVEARRREEEERQKKEAEEAGADGVQTQGSEEKEKTGESSHSALAPAAPTQETADADPARTTTDDKPAS